MATYICECGVEADWFIKPAEFGDRVHLHLARAACDEHLVRDLRRELTYYKQAGLTKAARVFDVSGYKASPNPAGEDTTE